jgi:hypothetical protein
MEQTPVSPLQKALEVVEALPTEDQETLIDVVCRRLAEQRRTEIAHNAAETLQAIREGKAHFGTLDDLKHNLLDKP